MSSNKKVKPVTAAGGIIVRKSSDSESFEIVMIYRWGKWDLPKGKCEKKEAIPDCARREVSEELGVELPEILDEITTSYHEYDRDGKTWGKTTYWFIMKTDATTFTPQTKEDIEQAKWFDIFKAIDIVGYETLRPVLEKAEIWLENKGIEG